MGSNPSARSILSSAGLLALRTEQSRTSAVDTAVSGRSPVACATASSGLRCMTRSIIASADGSLICPFAIKIATSPASGKSRNADWASCSHMDATPSSASSSAPAAGAPLPPPSPTCGPSLGPARG